MILEKSHMYYICIIAALEIINYGAESWKFCVEMVALGYCKNVKRNGLWLHTPMKHLL